MDEIRMKYYAFISYKREDERWAKWLQYKLENYTLPASIRAQDVSIPKNIRPIFRDKTDLSGTVLQDSLNEGLLHSRFLIVICSPHAVQSVWVNQEIRTFIDAGREKQIIPFIVEGTPMSDDPTTECYPEEMRKLPKERELLGINIQELGKEQALVRTVSTIVGVSFNDIWDRYKRGAKNRRILTYLLGSLCIATGIFLWDYNRSTYQYYADYVDCYGIPKGVLPLTEEQQARRSRCYRFEYRRIPFGEPHAYSWRVNRVDYVNSHDVVQPIKDTEVTLRTPSIRLEYYEDGTVSRIISYNDKGRILFRQSLSERHGVTAAVADFLSAREQLGAGFNMLDVVSNHQDTDAKDIMDYFEQDKSNIVRYVYERDKNGYIIGVSFHSSNDHDLTRSIACDANGIAGLHYELDTLGRPVRIILINRQHQPTTDRKGLSYKKIKYDAYGNNCEVTNHDLKGNLIMNASLWAKRVIHSDKNGNIHTISYRDVNGKPCHITGKYAYIQWRYNHRGDIVREGFFDAYRKPCICGSGYSFCTFTTDAPGYAIEEKYYDTKGYPCIAEVGYARKTVKYDSHSNRVEEQYFDTNNQLCATTQGLARWKMDYDDHGNIVEEQYFDVNNRPCVWTEGYARCVTVYDELDLPIEERYYDVNNRPCISSNGFSKVLAEYDDRGNLIRHTYYDVEGKPCKSAMGYAEWVGQYDDRGKRIREEYRDERGKLCAIDKGYACVNYTYNEQGKCTEVSYLGTNEEPVLNAQGYARYVSEYNERGDEVKESYYGVDGKPCNGYDGAAGWSAKYDNYGNVIELLFLDEKARPFCLTSGGYARYTNIYDQNFNVVKVCYYDAQGNPCKQGSGYAIWTARYDDRGNKIESSYYDEAGHPCITNDGYARWTAAYDVRNFLTETRYYNTEGKLAPSKNGYAYNIVEHDERGNWTDIKYYDAAGKPCLAYGIYAHWTGEYNELGQLVTQHYYDLKGKEIKK
jgi:YD repeat-containing protein